MPDDTGTEVLQRTEYWNRVVHFHGWSWLLGFAVGVNVIVLTHEKGLFSLIVLIVAGLLSVYNWNKERGETVYEREATDV